MKQRYSKMKPYLKPVVGAIGFLVGGLLMRHSAQDAYDTLEGILIKPEDQEELEEDSD